MKYLILLLIPTFAFADTCTCPCPSPTGVPVILPSPSLKPSPLASLIPSPAPSLKPSSLPVPAGTRVGPNQAVKDLSKLADGGSYVLDPGTYAVPPLVIKKSLSIVSADPAHRAVLKFPNAWKSKPASGPDYGSDVYPTLNCYGVCTMKDVNTVGGEDVVAFTTQPGSVLNIQNVTMDGGGILRGSGGKSATLINVESTGYPRAYFVANFNNQQVNLLWDNSASKLTVKQGQHRGADGKPIGEAAIRLMDITHSVLKGITTEAWLHDGKNVWKQEVQARPDSTLEEFINCHFNLVDIGDMTWRKPPLLVREVRFIDSVLDQWPHYTPGAQKVVFQNTKVAGVIVNKVVNK